MQCANRSTPTWYTKLLRRVRPPNPSEAAFVAQVHYKPRRQGTKNQGTNRAQSSPDARASRILQQPYTGGAVCTLLRILPALSPPTQIQVHANLSRTTAPKSPPTYEPRPPQEIFLVHSVPT